MRKINRAGGFLLAAALCVLGAIMMKFQQDEVRGEQLRRDRTHHQEILDSTRETIASLVDVETGQRGYLITGRSEYLEPYDTGRVVVTGQIAKLKKLVQDPGDQEASVIVTSLFSAIDSKIGELRETVQLRAAGNQEAAVRRVNRGEGFHYMAVARELSAQLVNLEKVRLSKIRADIAGTEQNSHRSVLLGSLLLFLLVTAGTLLLSREAALEKALAASLEASEQRYRTLAESLEDQVRARTQELSALNKELEAFSFSVSHDLRAPLRSIDGFSLMILEDYSDKLDDTGRAFLKRIRAATGRMGELIKSLLELSRVNRAEIRREPISISNIAESVMGSLQAQDPERKANVHIASDLDAEGDPALIHIVLENLLSNAWKFSSKQSQAIIEVTGERKEDGWTFCVADHGAGFDPAYAERLFTPFQRLHSASEFEGIGIGLATVQRVIHRHGGKIWAESRLGKGAKFYFHLP